MVDEENSTPASDGSGGGYDNMTKKPTVITTSHGSSNSATTSTGDGTESSKTPGSFSRTTTTSTSTTIKTTISPNSRATSTTTTTTTSKTTSSSSSHDKSPATTDTTQKVHNSDPTTSTTSRSGGLGSTDGPCTNSSSSSSNGSSSNTAATTTTTMIAQDGGNIAVQSKSNNMEITNSTTNSDNVAASSPTTINSAVNKSTTSCENGNDTTDSGGGGVTAAAAVVTPHDLVVSPSPHSDKKETDNGSPTKTIKPGLSPTSKTIPSSKFSSPSPSSSISVPKPASSPSGSFSRSSPGSRRTMPLPTSQSKKNQTASSNGKLAGKTTTTTTTTAATTTKPKLNANTKVTATKAKPSAAALSPYKQWVAKKKQTTTVTKSSVSSTTKPLSNSKSSNKTAKSKTTASPSSANMSTLWQYYNGGGGGNPQPSQESQPQRALFLDLSQKQNAAPDVETYHRNKSQTYCMPVNKARNTPGKPPPPPPQHPQRPPPPPPHHLRQPDHFMFMDPTHSKYRAIKTAGSSTSPNTKTNKTTKTSKTATIQSNYNTYHVQTNPYHTQIPNDVICRGLHTGRRVAVVFELYDESQPTKGYWHEVCYGTIRLMDRETRQYHVRFDEGDDWDYPEWAIEDGIFLYGQEISSYKFLNIFKRRLNYIRLEENKVASPPKSLPPPPLPSPAAALPKPVPPGKQMTNDGNNDNADGVNDDDPMTIIMGIMKAAKMVVDDDGKIVDIDTRRRQSQLLAGGGHGGNNDHTTEIDYEMMNFDAPPFHYVEETALSLILLSVDNLIMSDEILNRQRQEQEQQKRQQQEQQEQEKRRQEEAERRKPEMIGIYSTRNGERDRRLAHHRNVRKRLTFINTQSISDETLIEDDVDYGMDLIFTAPPSSYYQHQQGQPSYGYGVDYAVGEAYEDNNNNYYYGGSDGTHTPRASDVTGTKLKTKFKKKRSAKERTELVQGKKKQKRTTKMTSAIAAASTIPSIPLRQSVSNPSLAQTPKDPTGMRLAIVQNGINSHYGPIQYEHCGRTAYGYDEGNVNPLHCFVRKDLLEIFLIPDPVEKKLGLRCVYCGTIPKEKQNCHQMPQFYPKSLDDVYRAVCTWQRIHFPNCNLIPPHMKEKYKQLKTISLDTRGRKKYWTESLRALGFCDVDNDRHGVFYRPSAVKIRPPIDHGIGDGSDKMEDTDDEGESVRSNGSDMED